jgi:dynactin complex subunit
MSDKKIDQIVESVAKIDKEVALQKVALESHTKQDENMYEELKRMNDILQQNTNSLREHMQNNALLKDMLDTLNRRLEPIELKHIQTEAVRLWVLSNAKLIAKVGSAIGVLYAALLFVQHLLK